MNYAQQQRDPRRHLVGISAVVLIHVVVGYALMTGLARKVVDVLKKPLEVSIIDEVRQIEPPPPPKLPPPRKVVEPLRKAPEPPPFVPPPEVVVAAPPAPPVVAVTSPAPHPVEPVRSAPAPTVANVSVACPNSAEVRARTQYPAQAVRLGIGGEVLVEFTVGVGGEISDVAVARSSHRVFNSAATAAVRQFRCVGQAQPVRVQVPFVFTLDS